MQFYSIVPAIFYLLTKTRHNLLVPLTALTGSFCLQKQSTANGSFLLMPCRLWQFMAGIISFVLTEVDEDMISTVDSSSLLNCERNSSQHELDDCAGSHLTTGGVNKHIRQNKGLDGT